MRYFALAALAMVATIVPVAPAISANPPEAPLADDIPIALLVDLSNGQVLFSREADRRFVPASVTKVMTAYTAFKLIDEGKLRLDRPFLYTEELEEAWYNEGSNMFLLAGERPTIAQLLLGVTTVSGNDASVALAQAGAGTLDEWLALMNANAENLGMANTHFGSPNGFPDGGQTYTTANDLALLGEAVATEYPGLYRRFFGHRTLRWREITQANHDPVGGQIEGGDGMKTGYTNEAGYTFLGSAERDGRRLIVVIAGSPQGRTRDRAARDMLEWGFDGFERRRIMHAGAVVGQADVQDGSLRSVGLKLGEDFEIAIPEGGGGALADSDRWRIEIVYRGPVEAPFHAGDPIGRLRLVVDDEVALEAPLEAARSVTRANAFQRIGNAFAGWME